MAQKTFNWIVGIVFTLIAALHLVRSIAGWPMRLNQWDIPVGASVVAFLLASTLAYVAFRLAEKKGDSETTNFETLGAGNETNNSSLP